MTKSNLLTSVWLLALIFTFISCNKTDIAKQYEEVVVVANRGSANVSFIDAKTNQITNKLSIPNSEPMYVVYVAEKDKLYVGDRAGKKIHIVNPTTKILEGAISVGNGVFHMWADGQGKQLWVNNDIDNSISVIDLTNNKVVKTINIGQKPHDVFLTKDGKKAYVSIINSDASKADKVFMYSTADYNKTGEISVGKDPHLYHLSNTNTLYIPCQSGQVYSVSGSDLSLISIISFSGAHGIFPSPDQNNLFVTNISGQQIYSINAKNNTQNGSAIAALYATPHNISINEMGDKMFVTHSGASANNVSIYGINGSTISGTSTIISGTNPFGLTYYKRELK